MPVSIFTQKEFLIESKLNGFFGVLLFLLDLEIFIYGRWSKVNFSQKRLYKFFFELWK